jgi:hypothetical protein
MAEKQRRVKVLCQRSSSLAMRSKKRSSRESYASREGLSFEANAKSSELR